MHRTTTPSAFCQYLLRHLIRLGAVMALANSVTAALAGDRSQPPANVLGAPVLDSSGKPKNYDRKSIEKMAASAAAGQTNNVLTAAPASGMASSFVPTASAQTPFWQYSIFGSGIGASNIVIAPSSGGGSEIIVGGNSSNYFGGDDFWHVLRKNASNGNYDQLFVSPIYSAAVKRIGLADVVGDSNKEIVVMLDDGRIYLYDLLTKTELGYINTGISSLEGLCLVNLQDDAHAELVVTTASDLFVFNGAGSLLWSVMGAGGYDVIVGQMDNDPALEIAATSGKVVDAATHNVQWTRTTGFGRSLRLAPFPGENYQQLIVAEPWYYVYAYDIARQLPRWSIHTAQDIGAIEVANVDGDATPELVVGDGQWGAVHVYDLLSQAHKWQVANPEHGVTNIAVADVDGDNVADLLWGAGYTSSGADYLYVADTSAHTIKWQSVDLGGPFLGPVIGDLDGDGQPELVVCSYQSDSGYDSGRILVFDLATLSLRGTSAPVADNRCWTGVHDLKLRDVEGDGKMEIIIGGDNLYDGVIEAYGFSSTNVFTRKWTNTTRPSGSPFNFVEVVDLDGNSPPEVIGGNTVAHTGSEGVYVYIFNYPATTTAWRSVNMASGFSSVTGMLVHDLDNNGSKEIAALVGSGDLYTFDGPSRNLRNLLQSTGFTRLSSLVSDFGVFAGDSFGVAHFLQYANDSYYEPFNRSLGNDQLDGIAQAPAGFLWTGDAGVLTLRISPYKTAAWRSPLIGPGAGRFVALDARNGQQRVFTSAQHAIVGLTYTAPEFDLDMIAIGPKGNDILVTFSALAGKTFRLERKFTTSGQWELVSGIPDQTATRNGPAQFVDYGGVALGKAFYRVSRLP